MSVRWVWRIFWTAYEVAGATKAVGPSVCNRLAAAAWAFRRSFQAPGACCHGPVSHQSRPATSVIEILCVHLVPSALSFVRRQVPRAEGQPHRSSLDTKRSRIVAVAVRGVQKVGVDLCHRFTDFADHAFVVRSYFASSAGRSKVGHQTLATPRCFDDQDGRVDGVGQLVTKLQFGPK